MPPTTPRRLLTLVVLALLGFPPHCPAAEPTPAELQRQIDELKSGQDRLLRELQEMRELLAGKPARADYPSRPQFPGVLTLKVKDEPFRGDAGAHFAVIEYSDFDCSFCARYVREVLPRLEEDFVKTGKLRYYFADLPEAHSTNALFKARAARCAGDQGRFWEMHDHLFAHAEAPAAETVAAGARALDLDAAQFSACLASEQHGEEITRGARAATRAGLVGTPAFLIGTVGTNGDLIRATRLVIGAEKYEPLKLAIEEVLRAAPAAKGN